MKRRFDWAALQRVTALPVLLVVVLAASAEAAGTKPVPAFPGAEGFGAHTPGGRGGKVYLVTTLEDYNTRGGDKPIPGSLRAAVEAKGKRIVVFRVSGVITLKSYLGIRNPYITIAGQTAPGDGVCLRKWPGSISTHDVIIRHMRFRPGDLAKRAMDALSGWRARNVILDHCSTSWAMDETVSMTGDSDNITVQWCMVTEALHRSYHPKGAHGLGTLIMANKGNITFHHNLYAHHNHRFPAIHGFYKPSTAILDWRNNVLYDWGGGAGSFGSVGVNFVGNYLKPGPSSRNRGQRPIYGLMRGARARVFLKGNYLDGQPEKTRDNWLMMRLPRRLKGAAMEDYRATQPLPVAAVRTDAALAAYRKVLANAGATLPVRDVVDARIAEEVEKGTGCIINTQIEVGGWPVYAAAAPPADSDRDGMPDAWEKKYGLDADAPSDNAKDNDGDGYTNIEEFLNQTDPNQSDTGEPIPPEPVRVQAGNDHIRGAAARRFGAATLTKLKTANATKESREALLKKVRESGKEVAEVLAIRFVRIPPTTKPGGELMVGRRRDKKVKVTLTKPYELSARQITQAQWETVMGTRPWSGKPGVKQDANAPATYVNHLDCLEFIRRLNACGNREYRLPTYCEWTHAGRGGHITFGNLREWCHDWYGRRYYEGKRSPTRADPMGPKRGFRRLVAGAGRRPSAKAPIRYTGASDHPYRREPDLGFRLQRAAQH